MKKIALLLAFIGSHLTATLYAQQPVPAGLNYQGRLSDAAGAPLTNGTYTLEFNIYDAANGPNKVWGPFLFDGNTGNGHAERAVTLQGRFNVILGDKDTAARPLQDAFSGPNRYVEIKVDNGSPILPRQQFLSSPYAFSAFKVFYADTAGLVTNANVAYRNTANTFTGNQTVNGSVTATVNVTAGGNVAATGNITAGGRGVAVGEENLRIVRGTVRADGSIASGSGFTSARIGQAFRITFTQPFSGTPSVTATLFGYQNWMPGVAGHDESALPAGGPGTGPSATGFILYVVTGNSGGLSPWPFCFTAIGPR